MACGPHVTQISKFSLCFGYWLQWSTITTADRTYRSSVFIKFEVQIYSFLYSQFLYEPRVSTLIISQRYHPHQASCEYVWHYILLWSMSRVCCISNCQTITCLTCFFSQLFYLTPILYISYCKQYQIFQWYIMIVTPWI